MRKVILFMMVSLDGFIEGPGHDLSWHNVDEEFNKFAIKNTGEAGTLLFGRRTYQLMESFWPSKQGLEEDPLVANLLNSLPKVVFSKTLKEVKETNIWKNVRLIKGKVAEEIKILKNQSGKDIVILGSNNLCATLLKLGLLDEVRLMINPVTIGVGTPLFKGLKDKVKFRLLRTQIFKNGNVLLEYAPQSLSPLS